MSAAASFNCEYCSLTLTGYQQYQQHLAGKKHLKKIKAAGVVALTKTEPSRAAKTDAAELGSAVAGYSGKFVTSAENKSETSKEGTASLSGGGQSALAANVSSPTQQQALPKQQQANTQQSPPQTEVMAVGNQDPVMNAVRDNLLGKLPLKRPIYEGECTVCNVKYSSKSHEIQHTEGKNHAKKMKMATGTHPLNSATFFCGFCNLQVNSSGQMDQHREGAIHQKKVEACRNVQNAPKEPQLSVAKKKFVPSSSNCAPDLGPNGIPPPPAEMIKLKPLTYDK